MLFKKLCPGGAWGPLSPARVILLPQYETTRIRGKSDFIWPSGDLHVTYIDLHLTLWCQFNRVQGIYNDFDIGLSYTRTFSTLPYKPHRIPLFLAGKRAFSKYTSIHFRLVAMETKHVYPQIISQTWLPGLILINNTELLNPETKFI